MKVSASRIAVYSFALVSVALSGCGGGGGAAGGAGSSGSKASSVAITADARTKAAEIFKSRCSTCHGIDGKGDGPGAANLNPKPRNYHDQKWQASVKDEDIEKTIVYGGAAVGKSAVMAANPDLSSKPEVVAALREYIRRLGKE
jgi:mono/diheme cytochrome c family protein